METVIDQSKPKPRRLNIAQLLAFGAAFVMIALFVIGMINRSAKPVENGAAPQFSIPLYGGGTLTLAEEQGKVVVVNFWASWCVPCRGEAPMLERVWKRYKDRGVVFIGVDYVDTESEAVKFINEFQITYPNGPDIGTDTSHRYRIQGVPETYFVNKDGTLGGNRIGPIDEATLVAKLEELQKK